MTRLWSYSWKSPDGTRHEDEIYSKTRDEVFAQLRSTGIKAIKVTQIMRPIDRAYDFCVKFGLVALVAIIAAILAFALAYRESGQIAAQSVDESLALPLTRRQVNLTGIDTTNAFAFAFERYLVSFACPGRAFTHEPVPDDIGQSLKTSILIAQNDSDDLILLKRIVASIKEDVLDFHSSGKSADEIAEWLETRQLTELEFRKQLIAGRENDKGSRAEINAKLRAMNLQEL